MIQRFIISIHGQVQGVGFRYFAKVQADRLEVSGFAQNRSDDSLYIEAEGELGTLKELVEQLRRGPSSSLVHEVKVTRGEVKNYRGFEIY